MRLEIEWTPYFRDTEYGMVGEIKAFSVVEHGITYTLYPRLPDRKGVPFPSEEFRSRQKARARAVELLGEFLTAFLAGASRPSSSRAKAS